MSKHVRPVANTFSTAYCLPNDWKVEKLGTLTPPDKAICYGLVQPGAYHEDGVPVVAIHNLNRSFSDAHRASAELEAKFIRSRVEGGDVILSIKGTIGRVDIIPSGFRGNISRDVARIRPTSAVESAYFRFLLESDRSQSEFARIVVGSTRMELSIGQLKQMLLPIAQLEEQELISGILDQASKQLECEQKKLEKLTSQKAGLMHDLLTGKVEVKVDECEAAHV